MVRGAGSDSALVQRAALEALRSLPGDLHDTETRAAMVRGAWSGSSEVGVEAQLALTKLPERLKNSETSAAERVTEDSRAAKRGKAERPDLLEEWQIRSLLAGMDAVVLLKFERRRQVRFRCGESDLCRFFTVENLASRALRVAPGDLEILSDSSPPIFGSHFVAAVNGADSRYLNVLFDGLHGFDAEWDSVWDRGRNDVVLTLSQTESFTGRVIAKSAGAAGSAAREELVLEFSGAPIFRVRHVKSLYPMERAALLDLLRREHRSTEVLFVPP
jgi:hypothetical protein